jgi:hypothetical protein
MLGANHVANILRNRYFPIAVIQLVQNFVDSISICDSLSLEDSNQLKSLQKTVFVFINYFKTFDYLVKQSLVVESP